MEEEIFDFDTFLSDRKIYSKTKEDLKKRILDDYSLRKKEAVVKIAGETFNKPYGYVLLNLFMINSYVESGIKITKDDLFNSPAVTQEELENYFNAILNKFRSAECKDFDTVRQRIYETLNETSDISGQCNLRSGNGISYTDFIKLMETDKEFDKLTHPKVKEGQYNSIEKQFKEESDALMKYFAGHETAEMYPYAVSGTGLNKKQVGQAFGFIGLKPDVTGNVIPVLIEDNFLSGMKSLETYFINAKGTRLALITNNKFVRKSGLN